MDSTTGDAASHASDTFDDLAEDLQSLRSAHGDTSYAQIAARIAGRRRAAGASEAAARIARSTVFDAFRAGRRRINPDLIVEIVMALGEDETCAEHWRTRCARARRPEERSVAPARSVAAGSTPHGSPSAPVREAPHGSQPDHAQFRVMRTALIAALMTACVGLNIVGGVTNAKFSLPFFLDMIGTAVAAIALGPWHGVIVALGTNVVGTLAGSDETLWFGFVNIAGALIWGYGYHRYRMRTPLRFFALNLMTALGCTFIAVPITILVFGGTVSHASATFAENLLATGHSLLVSFLSANLLASVADKLIAGYLALLAGRLLAPLRLGEQPPLSTA